MLAVKSKKLEMFVEAVNAGVKAWVRAGELIVDILDNDPTALDVITEEYPSITPEIIARFEQIGRKQLLPDLLLVDGPGPRRLRNLSYSQQERYWTHPVDVVVVKNGEMDTLKVAVKNLTAPQAQQVFAKDAVRDISAQRAWIEGEKMRNQLPDVECQLPYKITGKKVHFKQGCTLSSRDMARILSEIES